MKFRPKATLSIGLCMAAMLLGASGSALAADVECRPFPAGGATTAKGAASVEVGTLDGQPAHTAYFGAGVYRTTICDRDGEPVREVRMAPFRLPGGALRHLPVELREWDGPMQRTTFATRGDLSLHPGDWRKLFATARDAGLPPLRPELVTRPQLPPSDEATTASAASAHRSAAPRGFRFKKGATRPATPRGKARLRAKMAVTGNKCTLNMKTWSGSKYAGNYNYWVNLGQIPTQYREQFTHLIWYGNHTWQFGYNDCGWSQAEIWPTGWLGYTLGTAADATGATGTWHGGANVTDAGQLTAGLCAGAVGCAWWWTNSAGTTTLQGNIRFNSSLPYTDGWAVGYYDLWSLMSHEVGHVLPNLLDLYDRAAFWATMYGYISTNDATKRILSLGEYQHMNAIY